MQTRLVKCLEDHEIIYQYQIRFQKVNQLIWQS